MASHPGYMTDQQVTNYAVKNSLPPLTRQQRNYLATQIKPPLTYSPNSTDKAVAGAVVASWSRQAVVAQAPKIAEDLVSEAWFHGDPEVYRQSNTRLFLATFLIAAAVTMSGIGLCLWLFA